MEPEGSSPYTQEPATCPYPEPDQPHLSYTKSKWLKIENYCSNTGPGVSDPEDENTTICLAIKNNLPSDATSHPRRLESAAILQY
jgi:hypothetical protein